MFVKPGVFLLAPATPEATVGEATEQSTVQFSAMAQEVRNCNDLTTSCVYDVSNTATWALNGPANVVTLSAKGLATAQGVGSVGIAATFPGDYYSCTSGAAGVVNSVSCGGVTVALPSSIVLNSGKGSIPYASNEIEVGGTIQFGAAYVTSGNWTPGSGAIMDSCSSGYTCGTWPTGYFSLTWTSSAPAVATVSSAGVVTGTGVGTTTIAASISTGGSTVKEGGGFTKTLTTESVTGSVTVTVICRVVSLAITPANPSIQQGTNQRFTATGTCSDGSVQDRTATVYWGASNGVAEMSGGSVYATAPGTTTVQAYDPGSGVSAQTTLTVTPAPALVSVAITPANPSIQVGESQQFIAAGTFSDGSTREINTFVKWCFLTGSGGCQPDTAPDDVAYMLNEYGDVEGVNAGSATVSLITQAVSQDVVIPAGLTSQTTLTVNLP
ncbi:MAG TPA: hypothetical protein VEJ47_20415 [Candidatus Eremiobacteraceae bacterium]|nr:hypothetical protein [Candidatus Eremiobacteraceae bacterium]